VTLRQLSALMLTLAVALMLSSCAAVEGIFKAGVWVGALLVVLVVVGLVALLSRLRWSEGAEEVRSQESRVVG